MFNYIFRFALMASIAIGLVGTSNGQQPCYTRTNIRQQYVVQQQQYVQQYPSYQYTQTYQYIPQTITYPIVVGVPLSDLGINYYFSVTPEKRESRIVEQVTKELLARMSQNGYSILVPIQPSEPSPQTPEQQQGGLNQQPTNSSVVPQPPQPGEVIQPSPLFGQGRLLPKDQQQLQVLSLMQKKCMTCHKPGEIKKDIKLFNSDGSLFDNDLEKRIDIMNSVLRKEGASAMPPKESLTADEKKLILSWMQEKL